MPLARSFTELTVYKQAFGVAMAVFESSKRWPAEEKYSLTDQARRSSRAVCANIAEAWCKRRYPHHWVSKLTDADAEAAETHNWLLFARECGYLDGDATENLTARLDAVRRGLVGMMNHADTWCGPAQVVREDVAVYDAS